MERWRTATHHYARFPIGFRDVLRRMANLCDRALPRHDGTRKTG